MLKYGHVRQRSTFWPIVIEGLQNTVLPRNTPSISFKRTLFPTTFLFRNLAPSFYMYIFKPGQDSDDLQSLSPSCAQW